MKQLHIVLRGVILREVFLDAAKADAAYQLLKDGMEEYREYGNDKERAVSFMSEHGTATVRLADLMSAYLVTEDDAYEETQLVMARKRFVLDKKVEEIGTEIMGRPPTTPDTNSNE